jgi:hypothetical protein
VLNIQDFSVIRNIFLAIVFVSVGNIAFAQFGSFNRAVYTSLKKKRWERAKVQLNKALRKDSTSVALSYFYSQFYFSAQNTSYNIDSAYYYVNISLLHFKKSPARLRERLKRYGVDSISLLRLRSRIDSTAFQRAKSIDTEEAYLYFITQFPSSIQLQEAIQRRDEASYSTAVKANTYESFLQFLMKYPQSTRTPEARGKYEQLLYEAKTSRKQLANYEKFLIDYPASPYREEIEHHIFEIMTASGDLQSFVTYLQRYPESLATKKAIDIFYHLLEEHDEPLPERFLTDSLNRIEHLKQSFLVPIYSQGRYGFMDKSGNVIIQPLSTTLYSEYLCGNITEDVLLLSDKLMARDGSLIYNDTVLGIDDLGYGFLKIERNSECLTVIHKSGFLLDDCVEDARMLSGKYIALRKQNRWALATLAGRRLTPFEWNEIIAIKDIVVFKKDKKCTLTTVQNIPQLAEQQSLTRVHYADDVKSWPKDLVWVRSDNAQGVVDQKLDEVIPIDKHNLTPAFFGIVSEASKSSIYDWSGKKLTDVQRIITHDPWVIVQNNNFWRVFDLSTQQYLPLRYDSVRVAGPFVIGFHTDTITVQLTSSSQIAVRQPAKAAFIPGKDSTAFLMIEKNGKKTIYDNKGTKILKTDYDDIQYASKGLFIVTRKNKKGLLQSNGKLLLPVEFSAIGSVNNQVISVLQNMKFGLYNLTSKKMIKPQYDKNLVVYNNSTISVYKDGFYGFIDWNNNPKSNFDFDEILYWNDTTALIKRKAQWMIYHIETKRVEEDFLKSITFIADNQKEKIALVKQGISLGVMSNRRGFIIPATFSDVMNLGSSEEPLYFTEKHVEEADIYVVIYYDKDGKVLRRQVIEDKDYEKIYCSDN